MDGSDFIESTLDDKIMTKKIIPNSQVLRHINYVWNSIEKIDQELSLLIPIFKGNFLLNNSVNFITNDIGHDMAKIISILHKYDFDIYYEYIRLFKCYFIYIESIFISNIVILNDIANIEFKNPTFLILIDDKCVDTLNFFMTHNLRYYDFQDNVYYNDPYGIYLEACRNGKKIVTDFLENNYNVKNDNGPFLSSCLSNDVKCISQFENKFDIITYEQAFILCCINSKFEAAKYLLPKVLNIVGTFHEVFYVFLKCLYVSDIEIIKWLYSLHTEYNSIVIFDYTDHIFDLIFYKKENIAFWLIDNLITDNKLQKLESFFDISYMSNNLDMLSFILNNYYDLFEYEFLKCMVRHAYNFCMLSGYLNIANFLFQFSKKHEKILNERLKNV